MAEKHHYKGLTDAQVLESRAKHGENSLSSVEGEPLWKQFLEKFTDPIIIILLVASQLLDNDSSFFFHTCTNKLYLT